LVPDRVREITGGRGVDRVVEVDLAGNASLLPKIVAKDGLRAAYGSNAPQASFDLGPMILRAGSSSSTSFRPRPAAAASLT
jgi:NADPH2:quinone reductase